MIYNETNNIEHTAVLEKFINYLDKNNIDIYLSLPCRCDDYCDTSHSINLLDYKNNDEYIRIICKN